MPNKRPAKKAALGRGLGSLLGGDPNPTPRKISVGEITLDPVTKAKAFPSQKMAPIKEGIVGGTAKTPKMPSIIEDKAPQVPEHLRIWQVAIDKIFANKDQPRKHFKNEAIESLSRSIQEKGILQPITVRKINKGKFEIIAGERRWKAAQLAGVAEVPVIIRETGDQDALELALIENIQREDLNVIEEAEAYKHLIDEYDLTQQELAVRMGKERVTIANILRLLKLTPKVRTMVVKEELSLGQAKLLVSVEDSALQSIIAKKIRNDKLTVRASEKLIQKYLKPSKSPSMEDFDVSARLIKSLSQELQKLLGTKVQIDYKKGRGKLAIHFYSDDELNQLADKIKSGWS